MKLVTGTVARRLSLLLHERKLLNPHQFGFVKGGGCEAPIEIVNDMYEDALDHDRPLYGAFLDATSAFDTVQHPALQAAFAHIGAPLASSGGLHAWSGTTDASSARHTPWETQPPSSHWRAAPHRATPYHPYYGSS